MKSEDALLARAAVLCSILVSCLVAEVAAEDRTWIWDAPGQEDGMSPMTAINWTNAANWVDGILPGAADGAVFGSQSNPPHYVQLMENVVVNKLSSEDQLRIVGPGELQLDGSEPTLETVTTYAPIRSLTTSQLFIGSISSATCYYYSPLYLQPGQVQRINSHAHFGRDKWADTVSETIVDPFPTNAVRFFQTRSVYYYAPRGSAEVSGTWTLTSGSPYLTLAGEPHVVAVGAVVSGEGIPEGAFVTRVFSEDLIEISAPASTNLTAPLTFSAFSPRVTQRIHKITNSTRTSSYTPSIYFNKYRAEDEFRIDIDEVDLDAHFSLLFTSSSGYVPGQVVFHKTSGNKGPIRLGNCDVAFAEDSTGFSSAVTMASDDATANVSVFDGASASLDSFGGFIGSFVKKGGGALNVTLTDDATSGGSVSVCDGTLNLNGTVEGEMLQLASLSLEDDAVLDVGTLTVCCEAFDFAPGAQVRGAGVLVVPMGTATNGLNIASTVKIAFEVTAANRISADEIVHDLPEAGVPGNPVFWFDASDESSLTLKEEGSQIVKRWDDHRGSSYFSAAPWTAGNETTLVYRNSDGKGRFVRTLYSRSATEANRNGLKFVRSVSGIKVLFKVISILGSGDFGAVLLGGTSFKRVKNDDYISSRLQPIFYTNEVQPALIDMPVYINGERCDWHNGYPYAGGGTDNVDQCRPMVVDMAFPEGADMSANNLGYANKNGSGNDNVHECIAYTNELSVSEILKVRRYLIEKWVKSHVNHDPYLGRGRATEGIGSYFVGGGDVASFDQVTGSGSLCKYGDGELNVGDIASTDAQVHVVAGRLRLSSSVCTEEELPSGLAFHVDADNEDSFTFDNGSVQAWGDTRGAGYPTAYRFATAPLREQEPSLGNRYVVSLGSRQTSTGYSASRDLAFNDIEHIQTVVAVMGKEDTYGYLLGYTNGVAKTYTEPWGLYRDSSSADNAILSTGSSRLSISVTGGGLSAWLNGVGVNPFEQTFSGGWDVVSVSTYQGVTANSFCSAYVSSKYCFGGKKLAECLIFTNALTAAETKSVESYLNRKWFDRETTGCRIQSVAALSVDAGAELVVDGNRPVSTGSLRVEGRVTGSVALDSGATLYVNVVDGVPVALDVTGTIDVSNGGSVVLSSKVRSGVYDLCPAAGTCGRWTVEGVMAPYGTLHVENGRFMLTIRKGLKMIFR